MDRGQGARRTSDGAAVHQRPGVRPGPGRQAGPRTVQPGEPGHRHGRQSYPEGKPHFPFTGTIDKVRFDFGDGVDQSPAEKLEQHLKMD
jgi:hypothetical protein